MGLLTVQAFPGVMGGVLPHPHCHSWTAGLLLGMCVGLSVTLMSIVNLFVVETIRIRSCYLGNVGSEECRAEKNKHSVDRVCVVYTLTSWESSKQCSLTNIQEHVMQSSYRYLRQSIIQE
jgi:hypothetical protein